MDLFQNIVVVVLAIGAIFYLIYRFYPRKQQSVKGCGLSKCGCQKTLGKG